MSNTLWIIHDIPQETPTMQRMHRALSLGGLLSRKEKRAYLQGLLGAANAQRDTRPIQGVQTDVQQQLSRPPVTVTYTNT